MLEVRKLNVRPDVHLTLYGRMRAQWVDTTYATVHQRMSLFFSEDKHTECLARFRDTLRFQYKGPKKKGKKLVFRSYLLYCIYSVFKYVQQILDTKCFRQKKNRLVYLGRLV